MAYACLLDVIEMEITQIKLIDVIISTPRTSLIKIL